METGAADQQTTQETLTPAQRVSSDWRSLVEKVSYNRVVSNIYFLGYLVLLSVMYISNSHNAIEVQREVNKQSRILKELRWKYMDVKSQLLQEQTETSIMGKADTLGLKPSLLPAYKITKEVN